MNETTALTAPKLAHKLAAVMLAVERVPKRGRNAFHGYDYATEADIVATVRKELAERNIILVPQVDNHERHELRDGVDKQGNAKPREPLTVLHMRFTFIDGDSGEQIERHWLGVGQDSGDKGVYKAMTGAAKYFLMKMFLMPTGDDPEETAERKEAKQRERDMDKQARDQQRTDPILTPRAASPQVISKEQQRILTNTAEVTGWRKEDAKRLLAFHGFSSSKDVTVDKYELLMDALRNGATVPAVPGELAPEDVAVI